MSTYSEHESFLPNLPGFRARDHHTGAKKQFFTIKNGSPFLQRDGLPELGPGSISDEASLTSTSLVSTTSSLVARPKIKPVIENIGINLCFNCYFEESVFHTTSNNDEVRVRRCNIYYYTEDNSLAVVEKTTQNSGIPQGTLAKKGVYYRADNSLITPEDLVPGQIVMIFGRNYTIVDCDLFTKKYLRRVYNIQEIVPTQPPSDDHEEYRKTLEKGPSNDWSKYRSKRNENKIFIEAQLGNTVDNYGREGFIKYGNQKLAFVCVWDNTEMLYGDRSEFSLVYYLSDDTVEIFSANTPNSGRDQFTKLLKRSKLPKKTLTTTSYERMTGKRDNDYYKWPDLDIGLELDVYARNLRIIDVDDLTREFYYNQGLALSPREPQPAPVVTVQEREIPPPTGFGSDEDSLRSCSGPLQIAPPRYKKLGENKVLSFTATLFSGGPDDVDRRFVVMYFIIDGTIKILEPTVRNSGFTGGTFLSRRQVKTKDSIIANELISEKHIYSGAKLYVLNHIFLLDETNDATLHWMEEHKLPKANIHQILSKIRPHLIDVKEALIKLIYIIY